MDKENIQKRIVEIESQLKRFVSFGVELTEEQQEEFDKLFFELTELKEMTDGKSK